MLKLFFFPFFLLSRNVPTSSWCDALYRTACNVKPHTSKTWKILHEIAVTIHNAAKLADVPTIGSMWCTGWTRDKKRTIHTHLRNVKLEVKVGRNGMSHSARSNRHARAVQVNTLCQCGCPILWELRNSLYNLVLIWAGKGCMPLLRTMGGCKFVYAPRADSYSDIWTQQLFKPFSLAIFRLVFKAQFSKNLLLSVSFHFIHGSDITAPLPRRVDVVNEKERWKFFPLYEFFFFQATIGVMPSLEMFYDGVFFLFFFPILQSSPTYNCTAGTFAVWTRRSLLPFILLALVFPLLFS